MSQGDSGTFSRREFAGYLKVRIPSPLDARVLAVIRDPRARAALGPGDVGVLSVFGHRKAVEAVRTSSALALADGFLGLATAIDLNGDIREVFMALAPAFRSAELLHISLDEITAALVSGGASARSIDEIRQFADRPATNRSLAAFGLRQEGSGASFRYV